MWVGLLNPLSLPGTSLGILALFQTFLFPVPLWNLNRGALALGFTLYFGRPWISISHTHTCIHTYPHHIHTPLTLGIWSSELAQQSVTLNTCPHSITIQAPRKPFCTPLASCPGNCIKPHEGGVLNTSKNVRGRHRLRKQKDLSRSAWVREKAN